MYALLRWLTNVLIALAVRIGVRDESDPFLVLYVGRTPPNAWLWALDHDWYATAELFGRICIVYDFDHAEVQWTASTPVRLLYATDAKE